MKQGIWLDSRVRTDLGYEVLGQETREICWKKMSGYFLYCGSYMTFVVGWEFPIRYLWFLPAFKSLGRPSQRRWNIHYLGLDTVSSNTVKLFPTRSSNSICFKRWRSGFSPLFLRDSKVWKLLCIHCSDERTAPTSLLCLSALDLELHQCHCSPTSDSQSKLTNGNLNCPSLYVSVHRTCPCIPTVPGLLAKSTDLDSTKH